MSCNQSEECAEDMTSFKNVDPRTSAPQIDKIKITDKIKKIFAEQLISSVKIPPLPKIAFDSAFIITESEEEDEEEEAPLLENASQMIEVPKGFLPPDYKTFEVPYPKISFDPDTFQKQCFYYISRGKNIFVTAHTSSGKTLIAEYAAYMAELHDTKVIYTSPIKALSNQKYREFSQKFESVGILTGDAQINSGAKCLVMTTEILRNMLYRTSEVLTGVEFIVFDEIHYLGDRERGVVWEEVIIMLPRHIVLVFLSATSPNAKDMSQWISTTKGKDIYLIGTEKRAVDLEHCVYFRRELYTLCKSEVFSHEEYLRAKRAGAAEAFREKHQIAGDPAKSKLQVPKLKQRALNVLESPLRIAKDLVGRELAPIVFFDFSKSRIEQSFSLCASLDLTTTEEKELIRGFIQDALQKLPASDRELPQIQFVVPNLLKGVGMHHSGLLPILKEVVELLFTTGALRVLFATETLAMGLNMPARTVVLRTLKKYNAETMCYTDINTNEYTQMAGRAGRRGYDTKGTVVIENSGQEILPEELLVRLQTGKPCRIESKFYITPRMILKLLRAKSVSVEEMVRLSFGKSKREREVRKLMQRQRDLREILADPFFCARCSADIDKYTKEYHRIVAKRVEVIKAVAVSREAGREERRQISALGSKIVTRSGAVVKVVSIAQADRIKVRILVKGPKRVEEEMKKEERMSISVPHSAVLSVASGAQDIAEGGSEEGEEEYEIDAEDIVAVIRDGEVAEFVPKEYLLREEAEAAREKWESLSGYSCLQCPEFSAHYSAYLREYTAKEEIEKIEKTLACTSSDNLAENNYFGYILFLQKMGYVDELSNLKLKGRVACEFNTIDCVLATEILFSPRTASLTASQLIIGALSITFHERYQLEEEASHPNHLTRIARVKALYPALEAIDQIVDGLRNVYKEYSIPMVEPNHAVCGELQMWLEGFSLAEIINASGLSEGVIVKYIKKATELCTEFSVAVRTLGNADLSEKIEKTGEMLKRGIVFTPSLYYG